MPVIASGPVAVGAPHPVCSAVLAGTESDITIAVMLEPVVLVPTTRYAMQLPGLVLTPAGIAVFVHGAAGTPAENVTVGVALQLVSC